MSTGEESTGPVNPYGHKINLEPMRDLKPQPKPGHPVARRLGMVAAALALGFGLFAAVRLDPNLYTTTPPPYANMLAPVTQPGHHKKHNFFAAPALLPIVPVVATTAPPRTVSTRHPADPKPAKPKPTHPAPTSSLAPTPTATPSPTPTPTPTATPTPTPTPTQPVPTPTE
jgi:hypothetical protein